MIHLHAPEGSRVSRLRARRTELYGSDPYAGFSRNSAEINQITRQLREVQTAFGFLKDAVRHERMIGDSTATVTQVFADLWPHKDLWPRGMNTGLQLREFSAAAYYREDGTEAKDLQEVAC